MFCFVVGAIVTTSAQIKQGTIAFDMIFSSDDPEMETALDMMSGYKIILSFQPGNSRSDIIMGSMGTMTNIVDEKTRKTLTLMDMMGMKTAMEFTADEGSGETDEPISVEISKETRKICGYTCNKATVVDDEGETIIVWYTPEISSNIDGHDYLNRSAGITGFPLALGFEEEDGMTLEIMAKEVSDKVDKTLFSMAIPDGYDLMDDEEIEEMMGGEEE